MASIQTLTFTGIGVTGESIDLTGNGTTLTFKNTRSAPSQVTIRPNIGSQIDSFVVSLNTDYNLSSQYTITATSTTIAIEHEDNDHFDDYVDGTHNLTSNITSAITTTAQRTPLVMTNEFTAADADKCNNVKSTLTFNTLVVNLTIGVSNSFTEPALEIYNGVGGAVSFDIDVSRNYKYLFIFATTLSGTDFYSFEIPPILEMLPVTITDNYQGAFITVNSNIDSVDNTYAIRDTTALNAQILDYQSSNVFGALEDGEYRAFCKDAYGCEKSIEFIVSQEESAATFSVPKQAYVSVKNSIPMHDRTDNYNLTSSINSFLVSELPDPIKEKNFRQIYSKGQKVTQQFWSSYPVNKVSLVTCNATNGLVVSEDDVITISSPIVQKTQNINRETFLGGILENLPLYPSMAIRFIPSDVYDGNGTVIGTHGYNGVLPLFYEVGTPIRVNGESRLIIDIIEQDGIEYAITNIPFTFDEGATIIGSKHVALPYEVFEYDIDFSDINEDFFIKLEMFSSDVSTQASRTFVSELITVVEDEVIKNGNYHTISCWNTTTDNEIDYTDYNTGGLLATRPPIRHLRNIPFDFTLKRVANSEINTQKLDNQVVKLDYKSIKAYETNFKALPMWFAECLLDMLNDTEFCKIDGKTCVTMNEASIEHKGHYATVKTVVAFSEGANELGSTTQGITSTGIVSSDGFYPVFG